MKQPTDAIFWSTGLQLGYMPPLEANIGKLDTASRISHYLTQLLHHVYISMLDPLGSATWRVDVQLFNLYGSMVSSLPNVSETRSNELDVMNLFFLHICGFSGAEPGVISDLLSSTPGLNLDKESHLQAAKDILDKVVREDRARGRAGRSENREPNELLRQDWGYNQ